jgi:hypothetical protein
MNGKKEIYITKSTGNKPYEIFKRHPNGNTRKRGEGEEKRIGELIYCSEQELKENIRLSKERAREDDRTSKQIFRELIPFIQQYGNRSGGKILYLDINDKNEEGKPKIKVSYNLVEKVEEIED